MKPMSFYVGQWNAQEAPIQDNQIIQVAVTKDKRWDHSFEVIEKSAYDKLQARVEELEAALNEHTLAQVALGLENAKAGKFVPSPEAEEDAEQGEKE